METSLDDLRKASLGSVFPGLYSIPKKNFQNRGNVLMLESFASVLSRSRAGGSALFDF